jgi:hypothetical protein
MATHPLTAGSHEQQSFARGISTFNEEYSHFQLDRYGLRGDIVQAAFNFLQQQEVALELGFVVELPRRVPGWHGARDGAMAGRNDAGHGFNRSQD